MCFHLVQGCLGAGLARDVHEVLQRGRHAPLQGFHSKLSGVSKAACRLRRRSNMRLQALINTLLQGAVQSQCRQEAACQTGSNVCWEHHPGTAKPAALRSCEVFPSWREPSD